MRCLLWTLFVLPLAGQPNDWPPMPESAKQRLLAWDRAGLLAELRSAAEKGDVAAQAKVGDMYARGKGFDKDEAEAVNWFRRAADRGGSLSPRDDRGLHRRASPDGAALAPAPSPGGLCAR